MLPLVKQLSKQHAYLTGKFVHCIIQIYVMSGFENLIHSGLVCLPCKLFWKGTPKLFFLSPLESHIFEMFHTRAIKNLEACELLDCLTQLYEKDCQMFYTKYFCEIKNAKVFSHVGPEGYGPI